MRVCRALAVPVASSLVLEHFGMRYFDALIALTNANVLSCCSALRQLSCFDTKTQVRTYESLQSKYWNFSTCELRKGMLNVVFQASKSLGGYYKL